MINIPSLSRRRFFKSATLASGTLLGSSLLYGEALSNSVNATVAISQEFQNQNFRHSGGVAGLLFSQIGYELGYPVRIIVRLPKKELFNKESICKLKPAGSGKSYQTEFSYWGEIWDSHWWIADFRTIAEAGEWDIEVLSGNQSFFKDRGLRVDKNILWGKTVEFASVDMLERRKHFTGIGAGWQDAGTKWAESPAQSAMIIALAELLEKSSTRFDQSFIERINNQIIIGCNYLVLTQDKARELGFPEGAMSHDILGHEKDILPHDAMKAVIALAKAAKLLPELYNEKKVVYQKAAEKTFNWLLTKARPMGGYGYSKFQRGLPETTIVPADEYPTRDLILMCRAALEMRNLKFANTDEIAIKYVNLVIGRQIPKDRSESGYYGHFLEFATLSHSEPSWTHGIIGEEFGADMGGIYPNYLVPMIEMLQIWPDHKDAPLWKSTLEKFAYGFLIPSCEKNPFLLVPQGIFGAEGPVWFCGTFHGTNAIYGFTAALAFELSKLFNEPILKEIAYGNLQWIAGLNGGITSDNLKEGCVVFSTDIPEGVALPASMMCGVGNRWAGTWFQTRGVICNGFSTGKQFVYDTEPKKKNDGPLSLTDEDWIPHSAAWLTGLMRL